MCCPVKDDSDQTVTILAAVLAFVALAGITCLSVLSREGRKWEKDDHNGCCGRSCGTNG